MPILSPHAASLAAQLEKGKFKMKTSMPHCHTEQTDNGCKVTLYFRDGKKIVYNIVETATGAVRHVDHSEYSTAYNRCFADVFNSVDDAETASRPIEWLNEMLTGQCVLMAQNNGKQDVDYRTERLKFYARAVGFAIRDIKFVEGGAK
ncbi:hypothetical protein UFOVP605_42 [uncultured Caudovirales phage]|uniref:Uncharacterized protein n=1 Tax=uncultured Caudovirales phage TaxID=2100421 RepID=A0A6J5N7H2_9CAUD|nr:hypothetical protein UFOVP605_42 [uncultured Caudovirales phage]